jgi:hypothetical protein
MWTPEPHPTSIAGSYRAKAAARHHVLSKARQQVLKEIRERRERMAASVSGVPEGTLVGGVRVKKVPAEDGGPVLPTVLLLVEPGKDGQEELGVVFLMGLMKLGLISKRLWLVGRGRDKLRVLRSIMLKVSKRVFREREIKVVLGLARDEGEDGDVEERGRRERRAGEKDLWVEIPSDKLYTAEEVIDNALGKGVQEPVTVVCMNGGAHVLYEYLKGGDKGKRTEMMKMAVKEVVFGWYGLERKGEEEEGEGEGEALRQWAYREGIRSVYVGKKGGWAARMSQAELFRRRRGDMGGQEMEYIASLVAHDMRILWRMTVEKDGVPLWFTPQAYIKRFCTAEGKVGEENKDKVEDWPWVWHHMTGLAMGGVLTILCAVPMLREEWLEVQTLAVDGVRGVSIHEVVGKDASGVRSREELRKYIVDVFKEVVPESPSRPPSPLLL